jgi:hypothetical protein
MANLKINLAPVKAVLSEYDISRSEIKAYANVVRSSILHEVHKNLIKIVSNELRSTKGIYLNSIVVTKNQIYLKGLMANAIEGGGEPYDMKIGFSKSYKIKRKKDGGWYLTIPFSIGTPNSTGAETSAVMSWSIYRAIKAGRKPDLKNYPPNSRPRVENSVGHVFEEYQHKASIFEGIKTTKMNSGLNSYNTFRRVSDKSPPNSWINRGITARNFMDKAWQQTDVAKIIDDSIDLLFT